uniref:serine hydrolase n=1 Tax=Gelidibacter sp. TaxID=2018083 RepID=UPI00404B5247
FHYSQLGYELLARILQKVTGKSFQNLSTELFNQYGLKNTFHPNNKAYKKLVKGYEESESGTLEYTENSLDNYVAAGSFISNVQDLKKWNQLLYSNNLVKKETLELMKTKYSTRVHPIFETVEYGYGLLFKDGEQNIQIGALGYAPGFVSACYYYPQTKINLIILENTANNLDDFKKTFNVHTEIGMKTRGAKVNGKLVPLSHELQSGDQVEILTSENAKPNANWLDYATTARARSKIKSSLKDEKKEVAEDGKEILRRKLKQLKINLDEKAINDMVVFFKLKTSLDLFYRVGVGSIDNTMLKEFASSRSNAFMSYIKSKIRKPTVVQDIDKDEITANYDLLVFGKEEEKLDYKLSTCCNPIPGDEVFGFLSINEGIKIHKKNCPNALSLQSNYAYRIMQAKWIDS